ncbi:hypothetical protein HUT19_16165 [Streptomyces sp. NA02950]|uniref:hypothetical protein n=1 Tax=Streptomyces sp. NA02950 TaxID=2742137 RepID=UPI00159129A4|nr:hypothetical protein [Streptomyces sp. NA02950]QKV93095.1 hypothetical protein HUT19_16165 [Streptomyces sp. NA02950]
MVSMTHETTAWQANCSGGLAGTEVLIKTSPIPGVDIRFANPRITEMHLVAVLHAGSDGTRAVPGLSRVDAPVLPADTPVSRAGWR